MGVGRRLFDLARANLNALMDRAARAELDVMSDDELKAELERRQRERESQDEERRRRLAAEAAAKARAQHRAPKDPRTRGAARRASEAELRRTRVLELYRTLGVREGAPLDEIKRSYRALMREHHPDRHAGDPVKQKAASARAATITTAYAELEVLITKRSRSR